MKPMDLARELDIPQPTIHRIVSGKSTCPHERSLIPIADFFNISVEDLKEGTELTKEHSSTLNIQYFMLGLISEF